MADKAIAPGEFTPQISPEDYGKILRGLKLERTTLISCEAKVDMVLAAEAFQQPEGPSTRVDGSVTFNSDHDGILVVHHSHALISRHRRKTVTSIKADYVLVFRASEPTTKEFLDVFERIAVPSYTWPYFRELVGSMTSRMDLPKLLLPLMHTG